MLRRRFAAVSGGLPAEYQEVEYIETRNTSSANAYIKTGIFATAPMNIVATAAVSTAGPVGNSYKRVFLGASGGTSSNNTGIRVGFSTAYSAFYYLTRTGDLGPTVSVTAGSLHTFEINWTESQTEVKFDGAIVGTSAAPCGNASNLEIYLFASNNNGSPLWLGYSRFKSVIIAQNGAVVRNFVACRRISDSKPGMYDLINRQFYTSAGSGEFVLGPDV